MDILLSDELKTLYEHRVINLDKQQLMPADISAIIEDFASRDGISNTIIGHSFCGQPISCLSMGNGPKKVLMWTQMHGDESTATAAVLDIIQLVTAKLSPSLSANWFESLTIYIIPMLNPDGAVAGTRENAQGIDINRDAMALQTPEGQALDAFVNKINPDFAFNLHDQHDYYRCGKDGKSSTLAFLAPAFDAKKTIDPARQKAMALIALMQAQANSLLPEGIARYDDEFSARSFGDQIAQRGISTILIESGHYPNAHYRQVARTMNVFVLLHALTMLCDESDWASDEKRKKLEIEYWKIPENQEHKLCDLLIKGLSFAGSSYTTDIAIRKKSRFEPFAIIADIGDLHEQHGLSTIDALGYTYDPGRPYLLQEALYLTNESYISLLQQGFSHFAGNVGLITNDSDYKVIENPQYWHDDKKMIKGVTPAGFLCKNGERKYALVMEEILSL
ncbi:MAG: hypothetical protein ACI9IT_000777 [Glaciecola sp.]|jgi:hypothetical protein